MMHVPIQKRRKWDSNSEECVIMGYFENSKAYRLMKLSSNAIVKDRDVVFFKLKMPFTPKKSQNLENSSQT